MKLTCHACGGPDDFDPCLWVGNIKWVLHAHEGKLKAELDDHEENREVARKLTPQQLEGQRRWVSNQKWFDCSDCGEAECVTVDP